MKTERTEVDSLAELRRQATLAEYRFTSTAPLVGGLVARLREAWNSVATKWQVRPLMEQQSEFNRTLVERLARPPGDEASCELLASQDRALTGINRDVALLDARMRAMVAPRAGQRLKIAFFSPVPPARSGIADYTAELLPHLAELVDLTVFVDDPAAADLPGFAIRPAREFPGRRAGFDLPLYQMGNSAHHETIYEMALQYPGVVVLHDYFIHHFIRHHTVGKGDWAGYGREMGYALGYDGRRLARDIRAGNAPYPLFDTPLNQRLIDAAAGVIVHSAYVAEKIRRYRPGVSMATIPHLVKMESGRNFRQTLDIPDGAVIFGSFGQITSEKQIDVALAAFQKVHQQHPDTRYLLVGETRPDVDLDAILFDLGLRDCVIHVGYVDNFDDFTAWLRVPDVVVNLRYPTIGETSGVTLRAMAAARPVIVYDHGWYSELPGDAALMVPPGDTAALEGAMEALAQSADLRQSMGQAGYKYVREQCDPARAAQAYAEFLRATLEVARA